jgi:hypothetical protein
MGNIHCEQIMRINTAGNHSVSRTKANAPGLRRLKFRQQRWAWKCKRCLRCRPTCLQLSTHTETERERERAFVETLKTAVFVSIKEIRRGATKTACNYQLALNHLFKKFAAFAKPKFITLIIKSQPPLVYSEPLICCYVSSHSIYLYTILILSPL